MAKELSNPAFDYSILSPDDASKLRYYDGELISSRRRVANEIIKHGEILHGAQQVLASYSGGVFGVWLESVGLSRRSAYNAIDAYLGFGSCANLHNLEVSAMYALTKNPTAKKQALKLADKGVKVTHAMAQTLLSKTPEKPEKRQFAAPPSGVSESVSVAQDLEEPSEEPTGKCPNCAGTRWKDGACARCGQVYGEPTGGTDEDRVAIQRSKTVKTVEALMRAFDDLHLLHPWPEQHTEAIDRCKVLLKVARNWS